MKKTALKWVAWLAVLSASLASCNSLLASVVYDNSATDLDRRVGLPGVEFGDQIVLAGAGRLLTEFKFMYYLSSNARGDESMQLFFRANDGPIVNRTNVDGTVSLVPSPGTLLYSSPVLNIWPGWMTAEVSGFTVEVPDTFTWTVRFQVSDPAVEASLPVYDPAGTGASAPDFWQSNNGRWEIKSLEPFVPANFAARATAEVKPISIRKSTSGEVSLTFATAASTKTVQRASAPTGPWSPWQTIPITSTAGEAISYTDSAGEGAAFFRIAP